MPQPQRRTFVRQPLTPPTSIMYVYIIECNDNTLYTGIASDIETRLRQHFLKQKQAAKYTKSHGFKSLQMLWTTETKSDACKLEYQIKHISRANKINLIKSRDLSLFFNNKLDCSKYESVDAQTMAYIINNVLNN